MTLLPAPLVARWAERGHPLSDGGAVALAGLVAVGAWASRPLPLWLGVGSAAVALVLRRPTLLCLAGLLLASALGARSWAGLTPVASAPFAGTVTLVSDPERSLGSTNAVVRAGGRRLELRATDGDGGVLAPRLAGERVHVAGRTRPLPPEAAWLRLRHVVGRLDADDVRPAGPGGPVWRAANRLRRTLAAGARSLPPDRQALFGGLVLGDDREQPATLTDDFRGAGLSHLLAVSGQNVAFVLVLLGPARRRLGLGGRWALSVGAIAAFALLTRFEPSVLRASGMAGLAVTATALGRPASTLRLLALAATGLLLVDPLLVRSVGFQLSAAASAGIVLLAPRLAPVLPGPAVLREALAVTIAAQLGVAPLLAAVFGGLPVVAIPANLLATPAAGLVVAWGLAAGLVAGVLPAGPAAALHLPTEALVAWIEEVARRAAATPLGEFGPAHVAVAAGGLALLVVDGERCRSAVRTVAGALVVVAALAPAVGLRRPPPVHAALVEGSVLWRAGGATVVVLAGPAPADDLLESLRRAGVRRVDLVASEAGGVRAAELVAAVSHRWPPGRLWAPTDHRVPGAVTPPTGDRGRLGDLRLTVVAVRPRLQLRVEPAGRSP